jgi:hypothetical protein
MAQLIVNWRQAFEELTSEPIPKNFQYTCLAIIILLVLIVRLATLNIPPLERSAWKEIDYLTISQNYWQHGFNFFWPEVSWPAEPPRVTEMEFPLVPFTTALLYQFFGFNVYSARAVTLFSSLLMILFVFKLTKRELGVFTGLVSAFTAGVLPLYHPFNRILFTEPTMIALSVVSLYYVAEWVDYERRKDRILAIAIFSLTIALKLECLYLFLPIGWIAFRKYRWEIKQYRGLIKLVLLALILPILWYSYAYYLEKIGVHEFGIFMGHNKSQTLFMLAHGSWYHTMANRVIEGILGGFFGTLLFVIGLVTAARFRRAGLFFAYIIAVGIYFALIAEGNLDAPYRQLTIIPPAAVFIAMGAQAIIVTSIAIYRTFMREQRAKVNFSQLAFVGCLTFVMFIPLINYKTIFNQNIPELSSRWDLAIKIKKYSTNQDKLIVIGEYQKMVGGYDLSPVLYYYSNRRGWNLMPVDWSMDKIEALRKKGGTLLVITPRYGNNPDALNYQAEESTDSIIKEVKAHYPVLYESQDQIILDLR